MSAPDCVIEDSRWETIALTDLARRATAATLTRLGLDPQSWDITLLACDDARIAELNTEFRDKPQPTNVLSWPSEERGAADPGALPDPPAPDRMGDCELGDIAIAFDTCLREAESAGKPLPDHVTHLVVHGVLHLLGFDHIRDQDATLMEALETEILGRLGIPDPYRE